MSNLMFKMEVIIIRLPISRHLSSCQSVGHMLRYLKSYVSLSLHAQSPGDWFWTTSSYCTTWMSNSMFKLVITIWLKPKLPISKPLSSCQSVKLPNICKGTWNNLSLSASLSISVLTQSPADWSCTNSSYCTLLMCNSNMHFHIIACTRSFYTG
jgi:hypothetical protein